MNKDLKILGVITARGGSKGIPRKNIKLLGDKPLVAYTIEAAKKSKKITHLVVSTDDTEIAEICKKHGADVPFMRPADLSGDKVKHVPVVQHAVNFMENKLGVVFDYVIILQPTSPFRSADDIDKTIDKIIETGTDSAVSLVEIEENHPMKAKKIVGDIVESYCMDEIEGTRRQDLPKAYKRSGSVYMTKRDVLMKDGSLYGKSTSGVVVDKDRSIDIDYPFDWVRAEYMLEELKKKGYEF